MRKFLLPFLLSCLTANAGPRLVDEVLAEVNDAVITTLDVQAEINYMNRQQAKPVPVTQALKDQILQALIDRQIEQDLAHAMRLEVHAQDINQAIATIAKAQGLTVKALKAKVKASGISWQAFNEHIRVEILLNQLHQASFANQVQVSDREVRKLAEKNKAFQANLVGYFCEEFLIPTEVAKGKKADKLAQTLLKKARHAKSFKDVKVAQGVQFKSLGWKAASDMPDSFVKALKKAKVGSVVGPIHAPNGVHILKLVQRDEASYQKYMDRIKADLWQQRYVERYQAWLKEQRKKAYVQLSS